MQNRSRVPMFTAIAAAVVSIVILATGQFANAAPATMTAPKPAVMRAAPVMRPAPRPRPVAMRPVAMRPVPMKPVVAVKPMTAAPLVTAMAPATAVPAMTAVAPMATMEATNPATDKPAVKKASTEKTDNWWQTLLGGLIQLLIPFVLVIIGILGRMLIKWVATKAKVTDVEKIDSMFNLYDRSIEIGVNYATQQSNKLNNNPDAKAKRIKWATNKAKEMMAEFNLAEKTGKWIEDAIEAKLGEKNGKKEVKPEEAKEEEVEEAEDKEEKSKDKPKDE